jgi:hypothetical protein
MLRLVFESENVEIVAAECDGALSFQEEQITTAVQGGTNWSNARN